MTTPTTHRPRIVIAGAGFGGLRAAIRLSRAGDLDVTLISATGSFAYYPQLYHAATGGSRTEASIPLTEMLEGHPVTFAQDTITKIDPDARTVSCASGAAFPYDELVLALGSVTNYFGIVGLKEFSYDIKTIEGAERFKRHLHTELVEDKKPDLNYVVVGGGPTGVELAAALGTYLRRIIKLHKLDSPKYRIDLVEAAPRLLPRSPEAMSNRVKLRLERLGVTVMTGAVVKGETADALQLAGESISSKTVVWTAGVSNNPFFKENAALFTLAKNSKVEVNEHLEGRANVYVIGDNAATQFSGMAQTAIKDADFVARDILRAHAGKARVAYKAKAPISVTPVGELWAAAQWGPVSMYGLIGYLLRRAADLIGYADMESWPKAVQVWLEDSRREDGCPICQPNGEVPAAESAQT